MITDGRDPVFLEHVINSAGDQLNESLYELGMRLLEGRISRDDYLIYEAELMERFRVSRGHLRLVRDALPVEEAADEEDR